MASYAKPLAIIRIGIFGMGWKKHSQELIKLLVSDMEPFSAQKKTMFGSTVYFTNDHMLIKAKKK